MEQTNSNVTLYLLFEILEITKCTHFSFYFSFEYSCKINFGIRSKHKIKLSQTLVHTVKSCKTVSVTLQTQTNITVCAIFYSAVTGFFKGTISDSYFAAVG